jgi:hypothetical protein
MGSKLSNKKKKFVAAPTTGRPLLDAPSALRSHHHHHVARVLPPSTDGSVFLAPPVLTLPSLCFVICNMVGVALAWPPTSQPRPSVSESVANGLRT